MRSIAVLVLLATSAAAAPSKAYNTGHGHGSSKLNIQVGDRPYYLIDNMLDSPLKKKLQSCSEGPFKTSDFVVSHRGAPLQFPEHSVQGLAAARRQGAGILECDVAFTQDKKLVCRHAQCDLHTTTNILNTTLAAKCTTPFSPATASSPATAKCCTSDITLADFKTLCAKMDGADTAATTVAQYMAGTPYFRTDLYATCGTLMTLDEYIDIVDSYGLQFTPELKTPEVPMPFDGYTQEAYAQDMIDAFKRAGIAPARVWPQSFLPADIFYWLAHEPAFGRQAVYLDERVDTPAGYANATASLPGLAAAGVRVVAPPLFALTTLDAAGAIVPSSYALAARNAGLDILTWSFERSGWLDQGGDYYYQHVRDAIRRDGDMYEVLHVLARDVGIRGLFSDWPATVAFYASCMGI